MFKYTMMCFTLSKSAVHVQIKEPYCFTLTLENIGRDIFNKGKLNCILIVCTRKKLKVKEYKYQTIMILR